MPGFTTRLMAVESGEVELFTEFENGGSMWTGDGDRERKQWIVFDQPFLHAPVVQVSMTLLDADTDAFLRLHCLAEDITARGFFLTCRTWSDSRLARLHLSWIAIGEARGDDDWDVTP